MLYQLSRSIPTLILAIIALLPIFCQRSYATSPPPARSQTAPLKIVQTPDADLQRRLQEQREAERVLKEGENLKREIRNNGYNDRQVEQQVEKVRGSGSNPQQVREADTELQRLRQQNRRYYYNPFYFPYYTTPALIFNTGFGVQPTYQAPPNPSPSTESKDVGVQNPEERSFKQILGSAGFGNGKIAPSIGIRYNNIGFEIGGIFNQDSLPGSVNDYSLPNNFLFNDLGIKKLSPQWGADLLGFVDVSPQTALYGSVGIYFQNLARIAQSQATNELYKQTDDSNITGAIGGGVTYSPSESISIGLGYHSLRGITTRVGISF